MFERLRNILHNAEIDKRVQYMIEVMFAVRKDGFKVDIYIMEHFERCPVAQIFSVALGFHSFEKFKFRRKCELLER